MDVIPSSAHSVISVPSCLTLVVEATPGGLADSRREGVERLCETAGGRLWESAVVYFFFFFQAEDGIRDADVTGVQTCALPISSWLAGRCCWRLSLIVTPSTLTTRISLRPTSSEMTSLSCRCRRFSGAQGLW